MHFSWRFWDSGSNIGRGHSKALFSIFLAFHLWLLFGNLFHVNTPSTLLYVSVYFWINTFRALFATLLSSFASPLL